MIIRIHNTAALLALISVLACNLCSMEGLAAVPNTMTYQGQLTDTNGVGLTTNTTVVLRVYTNQSGGTAVFTQSFSNVSVNRGLFSVAPGGPAFQTGLTAWAQAWVELTAAGQTFSPRQNLTAVPYAMNAGEAERVANRISVKDFGATGDGLTDDTTAFTAAFDGAVADGSDVYVPGGTYKISSTLDIRADIDCDRQSTLRYVGTNACLAIRNKKNLSISKATIDLTTADNSAIGLRISGCWQSEFHHLTVTMATNANTYQEGVRIESSHPSYMPFGAYILNFYNLNLFNGRHGMRTLITAGDSVGITHLNVFGGWTLSQTQSAFFFDNTYNACIYNVATEGTYAVAPYQVQTSSYITVQLGEVWQTTIAVASNASHFISFESPSGMDSSRFVMDATSEIRYETGSGARYYPSGGDPSYYVAIEAAYNYAKPFALKVRGGGAEREMIRYSETNGLELDLYNTSLKLSNAPTATALPVISSGIPMPSHIEKLTRVRVNGIDYYLPLLKAD